MKKAVFVTMLMTLFLAINGNAQTPSQERLREQAQNRRNAEAQQQRDRERRERELRETNSSRYNNSTSTAITGLEINGTVLVRYIGGVENVVIPAGVTTIGEKAFRGFTNFTSVTFGGSAISSANFGKDAFPPRSYSWDNGGNNLTTAYLAGGAGTYKRTAYKSDWTKQ